MNRRRYFTTNILFNVGQNDGLRQKRQGGRP
jgi:hypothetical protein